MFGAASAALNQLVSLELGSNFRVNSITNKGSMFNNKNALLVVQSKDAETLKQINDAFPTVVTQLTQ